MIIKNFIEYIKTFESYKKTETAVIEILKPLAWMSVDKYIQAVPNHTTKERLIYVKLGSAGYKSISTKNIKVLAVFDSDDTESIKKFIEDKQNVDKIDENVNGYLNLQRGQFGNVDDIWDFNSVNGQHGNGIYAFKAGDSAMKAYYSKNGEKVHSFKVSKKYVLDISNKNYDYWEARKIIFENPEYKVFVFKHKGIGIPTSKEYLITDPNVIILDKMNEAVFTSCGFESILNDINKYSYNEKEREIKSNTSNIRIYKNVKYNDYRFVYYIDGKAVSGIHFVDVGKQNNVFLQDIYTLPEYRRKGLCKLIYQSTIEFFNKKNISVDISTNLSSDGKAFFKNVL